MDTPKGRWIQKIRFLLILMFVGWFVTAMAAEGGGTNKECHFDAIALRGQIDDLLRQKDFQKALNLLRASRDCANTRLEAAVVVEMMGTVFTDLFDETKDVDYAKQAESILLEGLKLKTPYDEVLKWRLAILMRDVGNLDRAIGYVNELLKIKTEHALAYLSLALELAVETKDWEKAKKVADILYNRWPDYFLATRPLLATVKMLCHYKKPEVARKFIESAEKERTDFSDVDRKFITSAKAELASNGCKA